MTSTDNHTRRFVKVAEEAQIPANGVLPVQLDDCKLVIVRHAGKIFALEDRCSHDNGTLSGGELLDNGQLECPRHGACFDISNGKPTCLPAIKAIDTYTVDVRDGQIWLALPI